MCLFTQSHKQSPTSHQTIKRSSTCHFRSLPSPDPQVETNEPEEGPCQTVCVKPSATSSAQGVYQLLVSPAVSQLWTRLDHAHYVVSTNKECNEGVQELSKSISSNATVVPWVDAEQPLTRSSLQIYVNPVLEARLRQQMQAAYLCAWPEGGAGECVCELQGNEANGLHVVERLASLLPAAAFEQVMAMQLGMERRCPTTAILDALPITLLLLVVVVLMTMIEALWGMKAASQGEISDAPELPEELAKLVQLRTSWEHFKIGFGWSCGFVGCLVTLQTATLGSIKSTSNWIETLIWFVIFYPCLLATLGAYRLVNLLCRKQLAHLCLRQKVQLLHPASSKTIDVVLMLGLAIYALAVLTCAATVGWQSVTVVAVALIGPMWTLRKALSTAGELEEQLQNTEVRSETLCSGSDLPKVKSMTWNAMIADARSGKVFRKVLESSTSDEDQEDRDFNLLRDFTWHRRAVWRDGCTSGFFVVPGFAALVGAFVGVSLLQGSLYACSKGQLSKLQLATDLHSLHFQPYQRKYSVFMDTSFNQVAVLGTAKVSATRFIAFQQPESAASKASATSNATDKISDDEGVGLEEIQLSQALVPRIATVRVQGVRPSLDPTEFAIRFSPLRTLPFLVTLTADSFSAKVAWSTLPGSILSLPEGLGSFDMTVSLVDFHLGLPVCNESKLETLQWTVFEHMRHDNESCDSRCNDQLDCLASFRGHGGCYFAFNNHQRLESGGSIEASLSGSLRRLSGSLSGCVPDCGQALKAEQHKIHFRGIHPDWQGNSGQLTFALQLEVGEQRFESDFGAMDLHRGVPLVSDAIVQVVAMMKNGTKVSIGYTLRTAESDITVVIHEYDPTEVKKLQLLVLPVLADKAFTAEWKDPKLQIQESEMKALDFSESTRCIESSLLQNRYNACGAGPLKDLPISMALVPWISSFTPKPFTVALRKDSATQGTFPTIEQSLNVAWHGVDAPAAWAAKHKACELLTMSSEVNERVAASADALCELMKNKCFGQVEELMNNSKFGSSWQSDELLLASKAFQSVGCCHKQGQCSLKWSYEHGKLCLEQTKVQVSLNSFMEFLSQSVSAGNELSSQARDFPLDFLKLVAEHVWQMPPLESILAAEVATWHSKVAEQVLASMIEAGKGEAANFSEEQAQESFGKVATLKVQLRDAAQLKDVLVALRLAGNLSTVLVQCHECGNHHTPKAEHWQQLTAALCHVENIEIRYLDLGQLAPWSCDENGRVQKLVLYYDRITELPEELFEGTWSHLKVLELHGNKIKELPPKVFHHTPHLETLDLYDNQLSALPEGVFAELPKLKELTLDYNQLQKLPPKEFQGLASLEKLSLSETGLTELPDELFQNLTKLRALNFGGIRLRQHPSICRSAKRSVECNTW